MSRRACSLPANFLGLHTHRDRLTRSVWAAGGSTWEWNPLVNLAARQGRFRCVKELVEHWGASIEITDEVRGVSPRGASAALVAPLS